MVRLFNENTKHIKARMIPIYQPYLPSHVIKYAHDALDSTWISSIGPYKQKVEELLQDMFNVKYCILTTTGTSAMHLVALSLKIHDPTIRKAIVPNNVYVAAWNCLLFNQQYDLIAVDSNLSTWNMNYDLIPKNEKIAIMAVHNIGNIIHIPNLKKRFPNAVIIEDNCEGLFGTHSDMFTGTQSLCSGASFFGNKTITSGQGGVVFTNNADVYKHLNKIHAQGQTDIAYLHDVMGYNYRMSNIQAALLYGQLKHINEITEKKAAIFDIYRNKFANHNLIYAQEQEQDTRHSNWMMGIRIINNHYEKCRQFAHENGFDVRPMFFPISKHQHLTHIRSVGGEYCANMLKNEVVMLPSYPDLTCDQVRHIADSILRYVDNMF